MVCTTRATLNTLFSQQSSHPEIQNYYSFRCGSDFEMPRNIDIRNNRAPTRNQTMQCRPASAIVYQTAPVFEQQSFVKKRVSASAK